MNPPWTTSNACPRHHDDPRRGKWCCAILCPVALVLMLIGGIVVYVMLQPRSFDLYVTHAKLTEFSYNNNTLRYDLVLNFTVRNTNKHDIYLDEAQVNAFYQRLLFVTTSLGAPQLSLASVVDGKRTANASLVLSGQQATALDANQFLLDARGGDFGIVLVIDFRMRAKVGVNMVHKEATTKCDIKVPLTSVSTFEPTKCLVNLG